MLRPRVTPPTFLFPPLAQCPRRERSGLPRSSHHHEPHFLQFIVDAKRDRPPFRQAGKIMIPDVVGLTPPCATGILEQPYQLFLLGVDADHGISLLLEASPLPSDVAKLPITVHFVRAGQALA